MQQAEHSPKKDYLTTLYAEDQQVPHEQFIYQIQNHYMKKHEMHPIVQGSFQWSKQKQEIENGIRTGEYRNGICLLMGAAGMGKTYLMWKIAHDMPNHTFIHIPMPDTLMMNLEESKIAILFNMAKFYSPSVLIFDELDYTAVTQTEHFSLIKKQIDEYFKAFDEGYQVSIIGIGNDPQRINREEWPQIKRIIHFGQLEVKDMRKILWAECTQNGLALNKEEMAELEKNLVGKGYSISDILVTYKDAAYSPIRKMLKKYNNDYSKLQQLSKEDFQITHTDLLQAIQRTEGSIQKQTYLLIQKRINQISL